MKKVIVLALAICFVYSMALASETGKTTWNTLPEFIQPMFEHSQEYDQTSKYKPPFGYKGNLWLWKEDILGVTSKIGANGHYDQNNGNWGAFVAVDMDATEVTRNIANGIGGFFSGLFGK